MPISTGGFESTKDTEATGAFGASDETVGDMERRVAYETQKDKERFVDAADPTIAGSGSTGASIKMGRAE
jgi:hypothetical protein